MFITIKKQIIITPKHKVQESEKKIKKSLLIPLAAVAVAIGAYLIFSGQLIRPSPPQQTETPIAPLLPNSPPYQCPVWMDANTCSLLKMSCGNGVCDPHEKCNTCVLDCGCGGALLCHPEFGSCYSPGVEDPDMVRGLCVSPLGSK